MSAMTAGRVVCSRAQLLIEETISSLEEQRLAIALGTRTRAGIAVRLMGNVLTDASVKV